MKKEIPGLRKKLIRFRFVFARHENSKTRIRVVVLHKQTDALYIMHQRIKNYPDTLGILVLMHWWINMWEFPF